VIYRLTIDVRVEASSETLAVRECARRLQRMCESIPDGERRRLFMEGDALTVRALPSPLILPPGLS